MSGFVADYGPPSSGLSGQTATGTNQATAFLLTKRVTIFSSVPSGTGAVLPSSYAPGVEVTIGNRDPSNSGLLYPGPGDRIEAGAINAPVTIPIAGNFTFVSFDPPLSAKPRTWWQTESYNSGSYLPLAGGTISGALTVNPVNANVALTPTGTGTVTISSGAAGSVNNMTLGLTTPLAAKVTTFTANTSVLVGTGTASGAPYQFQSALNYDPSGGPAATRQSIFNTTLTYAGATSNIFEGLCSFVTVNGPGAANGEINLFHGNATISAGATSGAGEAYEAKVENNGTINGAGWVGFLALSQNHATGTVSSALTGLKFQFTNDNVAAGSVAQYYAIDNEARAGAGTVPTAYGFIRNADAAGNIVSLGQVGIGSLSVPGAGTMLQVVGLDHTGASFPFSVIADNGNHIFFCDTAGKSYFGTSFPTTIDASGNIVAPSIGNGATAFQVTGAGSYSANAAIATVLGSVGPTGSHTTVQEWLTIKNASGTTRYIPCF